MNIYEGITRNLKHQQLINNIESVVWGYVNGMNDDPENYKPLTEDQLIKYCYEEIFDIKDDGEGTTQMQKGICDDLKFLGNDLIRSEILRIGEEAGVLAKDVKNESEDDFDTFCEENHELIDNAYNEVMANAQDISVEELIAKDEPVNIREWERVAKDVYEDSKVKTEGENKLSPEEIVKDSYNAVSSSGRELTIDNVLDDILKNYDQDYFLDDTPEHSKDSYDSIRYFLRKLGLKYEDLDEAENLGYDDREEIRKKYYGDNFDLYNQPKEVIDEINSKNFFLASNFQEVLDDYENNQDSDWYIDILRAAQTSLATRKEQSKNKEDERRYKSDKKRLEELRKQHSTNVDLIDGLYHRIKKYEEDHK